MLAPMATTAALWIDDADFTTAYEKLRHVLGNVVASPDEPKYRKLRMSNAKVSELLTIRGVREVLEDAGFEEEDGYFLLPEIVPATNVQATLDALNARAHEKRAPSACSMKPRELREVWRDVAAHGLSLPVVEFYGHTNGNYRSFSNFYEHEPFTFEVPASCSRAELVAAGRSATVPVTFSEKAIMLCKASAMQDYRTYERIVNARNPKEAKALGRCVEPWNEQLWQSVVCEVAVAVVRQKFGALDGPRALLLGTGSCVIAEATRNDSNWGTGLDIGHPDGSKPARWHGTNILGWALIVARKQLRSPAEGAASAAAASAPAQKMRKEATASDEEAEGSGVKAERKAKGRKARRGARLQNDWLQPSADE